MRGDGEAARMPDWSSYFAQADGAPISVALDLEIAASAPIAEKPVAYELAIALRNPSANGMTQADEYPILVDIEEALDRTLPEQGFVQVGRVTGRGLRTLHYYGPPEAPFVPLVDAAMRRHPKYTYECIAADDPTWKVYANVLYPDAHQLEFARDMKQLQALKEAGDQFDIARDVEHRIAFQSAPQAQAFASAVADREFIVRIDKTTNAVIALKHATIDPFAITAMRTLLTALAGEFGGTYEGWSTEVQV